SKFKDFLKGEVRYASLFKMYPEIAEELANESLRSAYKRYSTYVRISSTEWEDNYGPLAGILDAKPEPTTPEEVHAVDLT
uniref:hypothetical protein n=1 Tax=uncultured Porphyromonas sp. TaxID=159274 RepID=UPI00261E4D9D